MNEWERAAASMLKRWHCICAHPASMYRYEERHEGENVWARITRHGREVVSPSLDRDSLWKQYNARVWRYISEGEESGTL